MNKYILVDKVPVKIDDVIEWAASFEKIQAVSQENIDGVFISTVFLGMDYNWGNGQPLLFETMIFGGEFDQYQERYSTWEEAEEGHKVALLMVKPKFLNQTNGTHENT